MLTQWLGHLDRLAGALRDQGHDPVVLHGGMSAKARAAALARLESDPAGRLLLVVATGSYIGEGFDCPGSMVQRGSIGEPSATPGLSRSFQWSGKPRGVAWGMAHGPSRS